MTRIDALRALEKAVEAGKVGQFRNLDSEFGHGNGIHAKRAYNGSLDAAKALHDAVLHGWAVDGMTMWPNGNCLVSLAGTSAPDGNGERWHHHSNGRTYAQGKCLSKTWMIAIIRALIAQEAKP